ncbi:MAG: hypothetical protein MJ151_02150, partial [Lachnospiraceae bacterium]|nr:hypothetical protein [Lachnospiraceae bacterium]
VAYADGENIEKDRLFRRGLTIYEEQEGLEIDKYREFTEYTNADLLPSTIFKKIYVMSRHHDSMYEFSTSFKYVDEKDIDSNNKYEFVKLFEVDNEEFKKIDTMKTVSEYGLKSTINAMDTIKFGKCPQASDGSEMPIEWILLGRNGCRATFISKYIIDNYVFSKMKLHSDEYNDKWENSGLYKYLNSTCLDKWFSNDEKKYLLSQWHYKRYPEISLLDERMCRTYFGEEDEHGFNYRLASRVTDYLKARADELGITITDKDNWYRGNSSYWTESIVDDDHVMYVGYFGKLNTKGDDPKGNDGVRPVITIRYK